MCGTRMRHRLIVAALGALHMQAARSGDPFLEMGNDQVGTQCGLEICAWFGMEYDTTPHLDQEAQVLTTFDRWGLIMVRVRRWPRNGWL
ncbi:hypothetical protein BDV36DRAFT_276991, partial [Aspergillus pseudocaelatus]